MSWARYHLCAHFFESWKTCGLSISSLCGNYSLASITWSLIKVLCLGCGDLNVCIIHSWSILSRLPEVRYVNVHPDRKWGQAYLTREFFHQLGETMPEHVMLVVAREAASKQIAAGALNLIGSEVWHSFMIRKGSMALLRQWFLGCSSELYIVCV